MTLGLLFKRHQSKTARQQNTGLLPGGFYVRVKAGFWREKFLLGADDGLDPACESTGVSGLDKDIAGAAEFADECFTGSQAGNPS